MDAVSSPAAAGLDGSHRQSCVSCRQGTDTMIGFAGPPEWLMAGLQLCGLPRDEAITLVCQALGAEPGIVPDGDDELAVRLCRDCHTAGPLPGAGMTLGLPPTVPYYSPARRPPR